MTLGPLLEPILRGMAPALGPSVGGPPFSANFANGIYSTNGITKTQAQAAPLTRASSGLADNVAGTWSSFLTDVARITDKGVMLEPASTNAIRNSSSAGGGAGANPTNWSDFTFGGLSLTKVGAGTENGLPYMEYRLFGTATGGAGTGIWFDTISGIPAANGDTWTFSAHMRLSAGSIANLTVIRFDNSEINGGGSNLLDTFGPDFKAQLSATRQAYTYTTTLSAGATVASVFPHLEIGCNTGAVVDITFRIFPQAEKRATATSPILTTSAAVTRAADAPMLKLPAGTHKLTFTFDDNTTQTVSGVAGGDYAINPANLNRPQVKSVVWRDL